MGTNLICSIPTKKVQLRSIHKETIRRVPVEEHSEITGLHS